MIDYDPSVDLLPEDEDGNVFAADGFYVGNTNDSDFDQRLDDYYEDSGLNEMLGLQAVEYVQRF